MALRSAGSARLEASAIRELMFGTTIKGRGIQAMATAWEQARSVEGELKQSGAIGPLLLSTIGASKIEGDEVCDTWQRDGSQIESCASVFRLHDGMEHPIGGTHLLATEFGPFVFSRIDE